MDGTRENAIIIQLLEQSRTLPKVASKIMSRNKFELILRFSHFENNDSANKTDRLYKIRNLLNIANNI